MNYFLGGLSEFCCGKWLQWVRKRLFVIVPYDRTLTITHVKEIIYRSYGRSNKNSIYLFFENCYF